MLLIRTCLLAILCLCMPCTAFAADITLNKFSKEVNPEPSKFNENFEALRVAILQSDKSIEQMKVDIKNQNIFAVKIDERLQALEKAVEQLRIVLEGLTNSTAAPHVPSGSKTDGNGIFSGAEYLGGAVKLQVLSAQAEPNLMLRVKFINMTENPLKLYEIFPKDHSYLIDENNNQYPYSKSELGSSLELAPHGQRIITYEFAKQQGHNVGKLLEFYIKMSCSESGGSSQILYVKIKGIRL